MVPKVTRRGTKALLLRRLSLATHWKLETWAEKHNMGKEVAAEKILQDGLKSVKLNLEGV